MKNKGNGVSAGLTLIGLLMLSNTSYASLNNKFSEYLGDGSSNFASLYIILGVIVVGLVGKLVQQHFMKEERRTSSNVKISNHSYHRERRQRAVVKKTS